MQKMFSTHLFVMFSLFAKQFMLSTLCSIFFPTTKTFTEKGTAFNVLYSYYAFQIYNKIYLICTALYLIIVHKIDVSSYCYDCNSYLVVEKLITPMILIHTWNLINTFIINDLFTVENIIHHYIASLLPLLCIKYSLFHNQIPYYCIIELSTIFFNLIDFLKTFTKRNETCIHYCKICFACSFLVLRNVLLPVVSIRPAVSIYKTLQEMDMRNAKYLQLGTILSFWGILVFLQYYWCYKIVCIIVNYMRGGEIDKKRKEIHQE